MPVSQKFAHEIATTILDEVGPERGEKLLDKLIDKAIIDKVPHSPKQSLIYIRNQFLLEVINRRQSGVLR